jgi:RNA polymerase sigma factor (sigma-70 family)
MYALAGAIRSDRARALKSLARLAIELCPVGSAGVSLLETGESTDIFRWSALAGEIEIYEGGSAPREWSPCGETFKAGCARLYSYPARYFTYLQKLEVPIVEALVIPIYSQNSSELGTIWIVSHSPERTFHAEHVRIIMGRGSFVASVREMKHYQRAKARAVIHDAPDVVYSCAGQGAGDPCTTEREIVWGEYLKRVASGDELALKALFEEAHSLVFAIALRIISFASDAEEIVSDVFARVWTRAASYDAYRGSAGAWLIGMARNAAIDRFRAQTLRRRCEATLLSRCISEHPDVAIDLARTESSLKRALRTLPAEQRRAIELFYYSGLSVTQIAERLGHPAATVKTRLRMGLVKLRRLFAAADCKGKQLHNASLRG